MNLEELRALCAAATPGPWHRMAGAAWNVLHDKGYRIVTCGTDMRTDGEADAALISAARAALPLLLDVAEAAQAWRYHRGARDPTPEETQAIRVRLITALAALEAAP